MSFPPDNIVCATSAYLEESTQGALYLIEGADGQMYGPADGATLRQWVADGRINPTTLLVEQATGQRFAAAGVPDLLPAVTFSSDSLAEPARRKSRIPVWAILLIVVGSCSLCGFPMLSALVVPRVVIKTEGAKEAQARADLATLRDATIAFNLDVGRYPSEAEGLRALRKPPSGAPGWKQPYLLADVPVDPWGHPYVYRNPGPKGTDFAVESYGADGKPGGDGDNADLVITG